MAVISEVTIYTDGACSGNPGPGGWAAILMAGGAKKELSGGERDTTNNRMELMAVIEGLAALKRPCKVDVYSDSAYVVNAFSQNWIEKWTDNSKWHYEKKDKKTPAPAENAESLLILTEDAFRA